ncbi:Serine/threonine protein kinase [Streptomyces sp. WMMB 714]|uniref:serine/threonine-protein kinase n=1 Tax=Streptomyces sp. WMMB 714 TaxID=1286822 RepID=UPI0005F7EFBB|nr:serine/threonine-protein kinase [Streptomyces sp. WMMB 714]SCK22772.1 Serine/threonine protein kinase [Streptomyces sp. WMMB 714]
MGEVFAGRYELADPIGRGGAGAVWRAWDRRRKRYVAAKVLQQSDAHSLLRFVREQALRIDHPHVLAPASWAADDDKVLFTMDLVSGGSLAHLIGDYGPLPPTFVCTLLDQLLAGLNAVHAEDVVHRDIKPANILLEPTGKGRPHLRLSDFGIAMRKGEPRLTETDFIVGTPGYFAPEQMMGADPDFTADLYAVGLVGVYLLTGRKADSMEMLARYEHGVPPAPERVPEPLWQVLGQLLQPAPEHRFRTATGARKALAAAVELLPPDATAEQEIVEVFDQIGPLPPGFGPAGPLRDGASAGTATTAPGSGGAGAGGAGAGGAVAGGVAAGAPASEALPSPSETGSFHLPPPQGGFGGVPEQPRTPPTPTPVPVSAQPAAPHAETGPGQGAPQPYQPYQSLQQGAHAPGVSGTPPAGRDSATGTAAAPPGGPAAARRPGPPPKVAVPVLIVALLCLAVGVWALTAA